MGSKLVKELEGLLLKTQKAHQELIDGDGSSGQMLRVELDIIWDALIAIAREVDRR